MLNFDVTVIGNGVLGLSTALALCDEAPNIKIAVIGPTDRHLAASPASGAMLGCFGEATEVQMSSEFGRDKLALAVSAAEMWPGWTENINKGADSSNRLSIGQGTFVLLNAKSAEIDDANYQAIRAALALYNVSPEDVEGRHIPGVNPLEDCRPLRAMYLQSEGFIDSAKLLLRLNQRISMQPQVQVFDGRVARIRVRSGSVNGLQLNDGREFDSPEILIAAGFQSQQLLDDIPDLSNKIPRLFPGAGTSVTLQPSSLSPPLNSVLRTPNRSFACGLHVVPRSSGAIYVGATNHVRRAPLPAPTAYDVHFLIECAMEQIDTGLHCASIVSTTVGHRPVSIDGFPLIGATSTNGLWLLTGTYRDGLHLSPLLAKHIARQIARKAGIFENRFLPERKPISTLTRSEAIAQATNHQMAIAYEHSARMPAGWHGSVKHLISEMFRGFYEQIESDFVLPPEFLPMIIVAEDQAKEIAFFRRYYAELLSAQANT